MTGSERDFAAEGEESATVLVARAWRDPAGFRARVTTTLLTDDDPQSTTVVVFSSSDVERLVREWLRSLEKD